MGAVATSAGSRDRLPIAGQLDLNQSCQPGTAAKCRRVEIAEAAMFGMMRDGIMTGPMTWGMGLGMGLVAVVLV